ncbi:hypothetical protein RHMOL_Rhmol07G0210600 [Rhododendron molle]|uniref:Uncharacterized protein n=1 Tax=Rhododendron molle TaxID=49168 RepID=A0ACC0N399_RHOML|nr:hypothetical protein RHMOL_Rhmol07G0210600 [Rhododendron molle]
MPRTHKDSATVVDVWSSTSAFDGYLSALSPLQFFQNRGSWMAKGGGHLTERNTAYDNQLLLLYNCYCCYCYPTATAVHLISYTDNPPATVVLLAQLLLPTV